MLASWAVLVILCRAAAWSALRRELPTPNYVWIDLAAAAALVQAGELVAFIGNQSNTRTYSNDGVAYYDVYRIWYLTHDDLPARRSVRRLLIVNYGTTEWERVAPWGGPTIGELQAARDDNAVREYGRIVNADLSYPIAVKDADRIIDGHHRLIKAAMTGRHYLSVIIVSREQLRRARIHLAPGESFDDYADRF